MILQYKLVDLHQRNIYSVEMTIKDGFIQEIRRIDPLPEGTPYLVPGFVDAHVHIESSMLPPTEFARLAVVHGTVATVSDPHEIANVLGVSGVEYMLAEGEKVPLKFCFGSPSCAPATTFETAGASLDATAVEALLEQESIGYLAEVMNFPGVLAQDAEVMAKIAAAKRLGKPIDGHAPGLRGEDARRYAEAGISTDHECFTYNEGFEKAELGMNILIREGSAARNFEALWPLIHDFPDQIMFCSDDKHPDDLIRGHINDLVAKAVEKGCDLYDVLRAACVHPVEHYDLPIGLLRVGDSADFVVLEDLNSFTVKETWIDGQCVAQDGQSLLTHQIAECPNHFEAVMKSPKDFSLSLQSDKARIIVAKDGQIVTGQEEEAVSVEQGHFQADTQKDHLLIAVVNRYVDHAPPALGIVCGFGLKEGAIASSVAHDSHNIVAVGTDEASICRAVNAVIEAQGGISAVNAAGETTCLALPIAGLMSPEDGYVLAKTYSDIEIWVKEVLGCSLRAPFMVLSFLALPVIPSLKITDLGLFDVDQFGFVSVGVDS